MPPIGARGSWWWRNAKPKILGLLVAQKVFHRNLKPLDTHVGVSNEAVSVCLLGTPIIFVLPQPFLHQSIQCCYVDAHKGRSLLATHWGVKPEPFQNPYNIVDTPKYIHVSLNMQRSDHKYTHKYKSNLVSYSDKSQVHASLPSRHILAKSTCTHRCKSSFMSSNWQFTGTCKSHVHTCQAKGTPVKINLTSIQPGTQKPHLKQKMNKNHSKNTWKK